MKVSEIVAPLISALQTCGRSVCCLPRDFARLPAPVRLFRGHRNLQSAQSVFSIDLRSLSIEHRVYESAGLKQVGVRKTREEVIRQYCIGASRTEESRRSALYGSDEYRAPRSDDFGSHVIGVERLRMRIDVADST